MLLINHCHISARGFGLEREKPEVGALPVLQSTLSEAGVDRAVTFARFGWEGGKWEGIVGKIDRNEWLCRELGKYPDLSGFATFYP